MLENRETMMAMVPELFTRVPVATVSDYPRRLAKSLAACAPAPVDTVGETDGGSRPRTDAGPGRDGGSSPVDSGSSMPPADGGAPCTPGMVPGTWARTPSGTEADFVGLFGAQRDAIFALADTAVRRGDGNAWAAGPMFEFERMSGMTLRLTAVGGFDAASTFAAGIVGTNGGGEAPRGEMYRVNGNAASSVPLPAMGLQIVSIRGSAANNVWAVGGGRAIQWDGARWVDRSNGIPTGAELYDVWAFAPNDVWAVGTRVLRWDGTTWSEFGGVTGGQANVTSLLRRRNGDLVVGGSFTAIGGVACSNIASWNGSSWSNLDGGVGYRVVALAEGPDGNLLVATSTTNGSEILARGPWPGWRRLGPESVPRPGAHMPRSLRLSGTVTVTGTAAATGNLNTVALHGTARSRRSP
jgi:hypothetical protein